MKEVAAVASLATEAWARRRRRTRQLVERHAFAADLLRLYEALLDVQEPAFLRARDDRPEPARARRLHRGPHHEGGRRRYGDGRASGAGRRRPRPASR